MGRISDARERLLQAATELVWQQSYGAVSVDAICEQAGVKKGSFYYFFKSKSDLAIAALEAHWEKSRPELERIFSSDAPPLDRVRNYFEFLSANQVELKQRYGHVMGCPFGCVGAETSQHDREICQTVREIMERSPRFLEGALRDAMNAGEIPNGDPAVKAKAVYAYTEGILLQARIRDDVALIEGLPDAVMDFLGVATVTQP